MDEESSAGRVVGKEGLWALARLSEAPPSGWPQAAWHIGMVEDEDAFFFFLH